MRFLTLYILLFAPIWATAQTLMVKDFESNAPLEFVVFQSLSGNINEISNQKGNVSLSAVESDTFRISLLGYYPITISFTNLAKQKVVYLKPDRITLDNVMIVANKWEQPEREVSQTHIEISAADIAMGNPQTSADLLGQSGAVFIQKSQQGGGSPMIRGFATNRVLISVDEVRMNNAIFRSGNVQNVISIDPLAIERTEVLFGPGSLLHGSDAIGGVMGFYTLKSEYQKDSNRLIKTNVFYRRASANKELSEHYDVKLGSKKLAYVGSISLNQFGDLRMGANGSDDYLRTFYVERVNGKDVVRDNPDPLIQLNSAYSQLNLLQKLAFKPTEHLEFTYAFHYSKTSPYDRYDRLLRTRNDLPRSAEWYYGPQIWSMHHFKMSYNKANKLFDYVELNIAYQFIEESRIDRDFGDNITNRKIEQVDAITTSLDFSKKLNENMQLFYGIDGAFNLVNSTGLIGEFGNPNFEKGAARYPNSTWLSVGAYASLRSKLSEIVHIETGLRYTHFDLNAHFDTTFFPLPFTQSRNNQGATTWSAGVVIDPTQNLKLSTNISTGFRFPNVDDIGKIFDSEPGAVVVPNPNLQAEYVYSGDVGLGYIFKKNLRLDFSTYYTYLDNAMVRRDFTLNGQDSIVYSGEMSKVQAIQNAANAIVYGYQIGIELKLSNSVSVSSRFSNQNGTEELEDGSTDRLRHAAPWFGLTTVSYAYKKLLIQAYSQYNGGFNADELPMEESAKDYLYAKDENGLPYSPAWTTYNVRIRYRMGNKITLVGGIENIGDVRYRPYSSGLAAAGRNFSLSLKLGI